jgi:hypothetical protein
LQLERDNKLKAQCLEARFLSQLHLVASYQQISDFGDGDQFDN